MQPEQVDSKPAAKRENDEEKDRNMNEDPIQRIPSMVSPFAQDPSITRLSIPTGMAPAPLNGHHALSQAAPANANFPESSPASTTSAFLLGIHNYKALEDVDLPKFVKEHQATLTFPEKLMLMLTYVDKERDSQGENRTLHETCVSWILEGRAFVIRNKDELVKKLLPLFFRQAKFASFTRKLYRWGFRQVSITPERISSRREMIFGHEFFQRDNKPLMARMRSVTAAGTRRALAAMALKQQKSLAQAADKVVLEPKIKPDVAYAQPGQPPQFQPIQLQQMIHQIASSAQQGPAPSPGLVPAPSPLKQSLAPGTIPCAPQQPAGHDMMRLQAPNCTSPSSLQDALKLSQQQQAFLNQTTAAAAQAAAAAALAIGHLQQQQQQQQLQQQQQQQQLQQPQNQGRQQSASAGSGEVQSTEGVMKLQPESRGAAAPASLVPAPVMNGAATAPVPAPAAPPAPQSAGDGTQLVTQAPGLQPPHAMPPGPIQFAPGFPPQLAGLGSASPAIAAASLQNLQPPQQAPEGVDPNAYTRAAIDMLLRYASSTSANTVAPGAAQPTTSPASPASTMQLGAPAPLQSVPQVPSSSDPLAPQLPGPPAPPPS